jgi:hypothetical protein
MFSKLHILSPISPSSSSSFTLSLISALSSFLPLHLALLCTSLPLLFCFVLLLVTCYVVQDGLGLCISAGITQWHAPPCPAPLHFCCFSLLFLSQLPFKIVTSEKMFGQSPIPVLSREGLNTFIKLDPVFIYFLLVTEVKLLSC